MDRVKVFVHSEEEINAENETLLIITIDVDEKPEKFDYYTYLYL